jgi:hypothetical protein
MSQLSIIKEQLSMENLITKISPNQKLAENILPPIDHCSLPIINRLGFAAI